MIQQRKREIRREIQEKRDCLTLWERERLSELILHNLWSLPEFRKAQTVFFFISFRSEVNTVPMIKKALSEGKRVCLPYTFTDHKEMVASQVTNLERELTLGNYDIMEPRPEFLRPVPPREIDIIILPGVAFDCAGRRLGYGGGYYDRFLRRCDHRCHLVALCFELQVIDEVPCSDHDHRVHKIVTEKRIINVN
jgi:5-formyltetrahydrofolate cyclo-ligase